MKYCQGPICHEHKTKDRIRGPKGAKRYETRRRSHFYYHGEFCSLNCQDDEVCIFDDIKILAKLNNTIYYEILTSLKPTITKEIV